MRVERIIVHIDFDAFYVSVLEAQDPSLRSRPVAVQQKQIIVTCNYPARKRGLYKLQLLSEARRLCPEVVILPGEDLTLFRNASQELFKLLLSYSWSGKCERLGFDEVFMDVTTHLDYNVDHINADDPQDSFFQLSRSDPGQGFRYDASKYCGTIFPREDEPPDLAPASLPQDNLTLRLALGSHLAMHLRKSLLEKGYTAAVGISTNKMLSKLVGNVSKPDGQTTLLPPYDRNVPLFLDPHEIEKIPGIGFKLSRMIKRSYLGREPSFSEGLVVGRSKDVVTVGEVRQNLKLETLDRTLKGPGLPTGIVPTVWNWIHGRDDTEVRKRLFPKQISFEDTYLDLQTTEQVRNELLKLSKQLISRIRIDLAEKAADDVDSSIGSHRTSSSVLTPRFLAVPQNLRLSTRLREVRGERSFQRTSRSTPLPSFVLLLGPVDKLAPRLVDGYLLPLFNRLHKQPGWNLNLINVAVTDISDEGHQNLNLKDMMYRKENAIKSSDITEQKHFSLTSHMNSVTKCTSEVYGSKNGGKALQEDPMPIWDDEMIGDTDPNAIRCGLCSGFFPLYALDAHERYHDEDENSVNVDA